MQRLLTIASAAFIGLAAQAYAQDAGDPAAGESVFRKCQACHAIGEGARNKVGPQLNGIVGREAASVEGYKYSKPAVEHASVTGPWDEAEIVEYLADPSAFIGGRSKMAFKLPNEKERADVVAYLATFNEDGTTK
ncbi:cytochrome c [Roseibium aquae]|uniref:Cytochrome c n=1 Tax=Roseibium aquae TaxID=1323746 RepID=A0A916TLC4_9HYPH|nr:cytochrome c family protein [Roseibium aquae]GGB52858.1 cytochrome c [Roseibium aquae]